MRVKGCLGVFAIVVFIAVVLWPYRGILVSSPEPRIVNVEVIDPKSNKMANLDSPSFIATQEIKVPTGGLALTEKHFDGYTQTIQGRVVDAFGRPVSGVAILARVHRAGNNTQLNQAGMEVITDDDGGFELIGLTPGAYEIQTRKTTRYESTKTLVQSGSLSIVLIVAKQRSIILTGEVINKQHLALDGVHIQVLGQPESNAWTNAFGYYTMSLKVDDSKHHYYLRFNDKAYRETLIVIDYKDWINTDILERNATLETIGETFAVSGHLMDISGLPVENEKVHLSLRRENLHYQALSNHLGSFTFPAVLTGEGYRLWVRPKESYNDYTRESIRIFDAQVQFDIVLNTLFTGTVIGRVIDGERRAASHLALLVFSNQARSQPIDIITDSEGDFEIKEVPIGKLTFKTRSSPRLHIENIELRDNEEKYIETILDTGWDTLRGELFDSEERLIGGALVRLVGSSARSSSRTVHSTITDDYGLFVFNELGSGSYRLDITVPGFHRYTKFLESGEKFIEVRLKANKK